jgi:hypothetical protein
MSEKVSPEVSAPKSKRVAVIAIHGVGHHESGATAQAVSDLLAGVVQQPAGKPDYDAAVNLYTPFTLQQIQFPLPPPKPKKRKATKLSWNSLRHVFEERRGVFRDLYTWKSWFRKSDEREAHTGERYKVDEEIDIATEFMHTQLDDYKGDPDENSCTTWKHSGRRLDRDGKGEAEVDVYEMYWADLARPNNSILRFLFSFYQLLLHLVSLGRIALDQAGLEHMGAIDWFLYLRFYTYATRLLTLVVLPLLVLLYGVALAPLPLLVQNDSLRAAIAGGLIMTAGLAGLLLASLRLKPWLGTKSWWFWLIPSLVPGALLSWFLSAEPSHAPLVLALEWWLVGAGVSYWIFLKYDQVRNGARQTGAVLIVLITAAYLIGIALRRDFGEVALKTTSFVLVQHVFLTLRLLVLLFIVLSVGAVVMEVICRLRLTADANHRAELARARAAAKTARFALAIPALLILLLAVFTGSGAHESAIKRLNLYDKAKTEIIHPGFGLNYLVMNEQETKTLLDRVQPPSTTQSVHCLNTSAGYAPVSASPISCTPGEILQGLIVQSSPPGMLATIGLAAVGFVLLGLIILPSVFYELFPVRAAPNGRARLLGNWLTAGLRHFHWTISLFWAAVFLVPWISLGIALQNFAKLPQPRPSFLLHFYSAPLMLKGEWFLLSSGGILAGSAVVLSGILVKYLSSVLDTILDVDTYLRTSPADATPRALIVDRYASLLRYIHACRDPDGQPAYNHVVIVAHSLGSLITADLLRFLRYSKKTGRDRFSFDGPDCRPLPIDFFSMGCPLRQLLSRFFPNLYRWVREEPEDTGKPPDPTLGGETIPLGASPNPVKLGLRHWVNFYRSGDYVGRSVWINYVFGRTSGEDNDGVFPKPPLAEIYTDKNPHERTARFDACIGLGAHTHYWDRTAADVSTQLDRLIAL